MLLRLFYRDTSHQHPQNLLPTPTGPRGDLGSSFVCRARVDRTGPFGPRGRFIDRPQGIRRKHNLSLCRSSRLICTDLAAALPQHHVLPNSTTHSRPRFPPLRHTSLPGALKQVKVHTGHRRLPSTFPCSSAQLRHRPTLPTRHHTLKLFRRKSDKFRGSSVFLLLICNGSTHLRLVRRRLRRK